MSPLNKLQSCFRGRKVFLTGHTGFKGSWLTTWLMQLGAHVSGYSLAPCPKQPLFMQLGLEKECHHYVGDICHRDHLQDVLFREQPDMVIHLAAQALVREGYRDPVSTFTTNSMGTLYVLEALRYVPSCKAALFITTDKVYDPLLSQHAHTECSPLKGEDPYSSSKVCAEQMVHAYVRSLLLPACACATARAGNVIGGGDRAADRLIPDLIRALECGEPLRIRYPSAIRPWQHVLEPLMGYLQVLVQLFEATESRVVATCEAWNFGPPEHEALTVAALLQKAEGVLQVPLDIVREVTTIPEAPTLRLNARKAEKQLGWKSYLSVEEALSWTLEWYRKASQGEKMRAYTEQQIDAYMTLMENGHNDMNDTKEDHHCACSKSTVRTI